MEMEGGVAAIGNLDSKVWGESGGGEGLVFDSIRAAIWNSETRFVVERLGGKMVWGFSFLFSAGSGEIRSVFERRKGGAAGRKERPSGERAGISFF